MIMQARLKAGWITEADLARGQELVHNKTITEQSYDQRTQAKRVADLGRQLEEAQRAHAVHRSAQDKALRRLKVRTDAIPPLVRGVGPTPLPRQAPARNGAQTRCGASHQSWVKPTRAETAHISS